MNNIYKNKIFYILNIMVKTGTINFCHYVSIKILVVCASNTRNMGLKLYKISVQKPDIGFVTVATSTSQHLVIINNHPKVVHPGSLSSPRFTFERQSLSFCILWCITNFTVAPCIVPLFNYHFERLKVFGAFYVVRQTVPNFRSKNS